jgi:hypothetical protein
VTPVLLLLQCTSGQVLLVLLLLLLVLLLTATSIKACRSDGMNPPSPPPLPVPEVLVA